MKDSKMLIFFFFVIFMTSTKCFNQYSRRSSYSHDFMPLEEWDKGDENINKDCVCFNNGKHSVPEILKQGGVKSLNRLVIYLYKDTDTNNLVMYVPNKENQAQFPDLGLADGDMFKVGMETVRELFDAHGNSIHIDQGPVDVHPSSLDTPTDPENTFPEEISTKFTPLHEIDTTESWYNINNSDKGLSDSSDSEDGLDLDDDINQNSQEDDTPELPNTDVANENENFDYNDEFASLDSSSNVPEVNDIVINPSPTLTDIPKVLESEGSNPATVNNINKHIAFNIPGYNLVDDSNVFDSTSPGALPYLKNFKYQNYVPEYSYGSKHLYNNMIPDENFIKTDAVDVSSEINDNIPIPVVEGQLDGLENEYETFDRWFSQQVETILRQEKVTYENVDLSSLKRIIEKTFFDNGLYITKDGVLIDSEGNILDLSNLTLRSVVIGESHFLHKIFSYYYGGKKDLPSNLPYLEAFLVAMVNPPKILGVIPKRKTIVPGLLYGTELDLGRTAQTSSSTCKTLDCLVQQYSALKQRSGQNAKESKQFRKSKTNNIPKQFKSVPKRPEVLDKDVKSNFNLGKLLRAFQSTIFPKKSIDRKAFVPDSAPGSWESRDELKRPDEDERLELPGFRIIGGAAATGSGTPVSNKGRFGLAYD